MNISEHIRKYPEHELQDILKFMYQSCFGCEHLVTDEASAAAYIKEEAENLGSEASDDIEELDGDYCRVHLGWIGKGLKTETLAKLFVMSSEHEEDGEERLERMLEAYGTFVDWDRKAVHHSERFRKAYRPAYRVIKKEYARLIPLFAYIDGNGGRGILAIDGRSGSGKSTIAEILARVYDAAIFRMDDFFLRPEQRTAERFSEPGGNVDRERFLEEVLVPLSRGGDVTYSRFDCRSMSVGRPEKVEMTDLVIVEGSYSMHPALNSYYDMSAFIDIDEKEQAKRILKRNGEVMAKRFLEEWIPMEEKYFKAFNVRECCDLVI